MSNRSVESAEAFTERYFSEEYRGLTDMVEERDALIRKQTLEEAAMWAHRLYVMGRAFSIAVHRRRDAEQERDDLRERVRLLTKALESISIRCREGDRRVDWLPIILSIASEALAQPASPKDKHNGDRNRLMGPQQLQLLISGLEHIRDMDAETCRPDEPMIVAGSILADYNNSR